MPPRDPTYLPLRLKEGNEPTVVFMLSSRDDGGDVVPYPSMGKTFELFIKNDVRDDDPVPIAGSHLPGQDTETETAISVQVLSSELEDPGRYVYHLDAVPPRETVAWGPLIVLDL